MRKQTLVFLLFLLGSCQNKENVPFLLFGDNFSETPELEFQYGSLEDNGDSIENTSFTSFESGIFCIHSLPISLYRRELGGKFRICWKTEESISEKWREGFSLLGSETSEYPSWNLKGKAWAALLTEYGKWKKDSDRVGALLEWDSQIWSSGLVTYQTYAVPHPLFLQRTKEVCEVVFPSQRLDGSSNKHPLISLEFPCPDLGEMAERIQTKNEEWLRQCEPADPIVSEVFRHSESSYLRFLEWENPKDSVICPNTHILDWEKEGRITSFHSDLFSKRTKVILPRATVLFSDHPGYKGIPIPKEFLSDLGTETVVRWGSFEYQDSEFFFRQGHEFFSNQSNPVSCRDQFNLWKTKDLFCGNPGLPNRTVGKVKEDSPPGCRSDQIQITEFYPGNHFDSRMPLPAYFEFQNIGETCDGSALHWIFEKAVYPLSAVEWVLESGSTFLITRKAWLGWNLLEKEKPFSIPKVVFQIPNFTWEERLGKTKTHFQSNPSIYHLLRFQDQNRFSVILSSEGEHPHGRVGASSGLLSYGFQMSPGLVNTSLVESLTTELLEFNPNQSPFLDFGFTDSEEGLVSLERETGKHYLFWKPKEVRFQTLATSPSLCNGENFYQLPDGFFSDPFLSLRYLKRETGEPVSLFFDPKRIKESTLGGTRSLHPEPSPIHFSRSLLPSEHCLGDFRSPGRTKHRSLEVERLTPSFTYSTNFPLGNETEVRLGNGRSSILLNLQILEANTYLAIFGNPLPFPLEEQLYSYFSDPSLIQPKSFLERKGPIQIEAIFPNPQLSQNEWIYLCNRSETAEDLSLYLVEDEVSTDELVAYQTRFTNLSPLGKAGQRFQYNTTVLNPGSCAWIVDPDGKDWFFPLFQSESDLLLTVRTTQTIGNGISSAESIQLRKKQGENSHLISSFGHKESHSPFQIPVVTGEFLWLKSGSLGMASADFEIFREEF
ncbi:lamin tail domain-containing protein [Leptospira sp. 201903074]|uniref:LIC11755 family lipoprotein n=1 Tax=Leptospira abararensis TaxID=2810036 RepID=UPI0019638911|nr:lamin tail domain-containing protein [Leptospira abararensis]MBM9547691.1 lamin tail domain-containing protein [Leptospira abararensis]